MGKYLIQIFFVFIMLSLNIGSNAQTSAKDTVYISEKQELSPSMISSGVKFVNVDKNPEVKGYNSFYESIEKRFIQPKAMDVEHLNVTGNVFGAKLTVTKEGNIKDVEVVYKVYPYIDEEIVEIIKSIDVLNPGIKNNKEVDTQLFLTISIRAIVRNEQSDLSGFWMPSFIGGDEFLEKYIRSNLKYPPKAAKKGIEGRVVVRFYVSKTGKVVDAQVLESLNRDCDTEALRVIEEMPDWFPCVINNEPVPKNIYFKLPVMFRLPMRAKK